MTPVRSKYGSKKTTVDGIVFDSAVESRRWLDLQQMERDGLITDLKRQVPFVLAPSVKFAGARARKPAIRLFIDFTYIQAGELIANDVKSPSTARLAVFQLKRHLMATVHQQEVLITSSKDVSRAVRTTAKPKAKP